jgi:hypothetical protein
MWVDYNIDQVGEHFTVKGDYPGEVMGVARDGSPRDHWLYKPGDVFIVNENGWLMKSDQLSAMVMTYDKKSTSK